MTANKTSPLDFQEYIFLSLLKFELARFYEIFELSQKTTYFCFYHSGNQSRPSHNILSKKNPQKERMKGPGQKVHEKGERRNATTIRNSSVT